MSWDRIAKRWRESLVNKLQERYGLEEQEARKKADVWLQWVKKQPQPRIVMTAEVRNEGRPSRPRSRIRLGEARSGVAAPP